MMEVNKESYEKTEQGHLIQLGNECERKWCGQGLLGKKLSLGGWARIVIGAEKAKII